MHTTVVPRFVRRLTKVAGLALAAFLFLGVLPESTSAASSWSPTLLVNTESFQTIDAGDGTTDIELRYGTSNATIKLLFTRQVFQFSKGISVLGTISGSQLAIDGAATISGALLVKTSITSKGSVSGSTIAGFNLGSCNAAGQKLLYNYSTQKFECGTDLNTATPAWSNTGSLRAAFDNRYVNQHGDTMTGSLRIRSTSGTTVPNLSVYGGMSGYFLRTSGAADIHGPLAVTGAIRTDSNLTINDDQDSNLPILSFGYNGQFHTLSFIAREVFQFSKGISVLGTISGSQLAIDGAATISGALLVKTSITSKGSVSGSTIAGFNLGSCNAAGQKLLYNYSTQKFECGTDLNTATPAWSNTGSLRAAFDNRYVNQHGDTMTGSLRIRSTSGTTVANLSVYGGMSGFFLRTSGAADIHGPLAVSGSLRGDGDFTINDDRTTAANAVLTFGNSTTNQTLTYVHSLQKFQFSKDVSVIGNLSGSTLTVDGNITLHGVTYNAPSAQGAANTVLKNDGAGNLTWSNTIANGSGNIISMHPDYPGAIYYSTGSTNIGQLTMSGGTADLENSYAWTSSRSTLQRYWISVRGRVPDNFSSWDPVKAMEFRFKTGVPGAQNNHLTLKIRDTAGALQTLSGAMVGTAFTTARIPALSGTWTPKGYFTVYVEVAAKNTANAAAYASYLNMNFETTNP